MVPVGDKLVDHHPAFKLYLVTRNATPALTPDVVPLLTITNFSITRSGLESTCCPAPVNFLALDNNCSGS